MKKMMLKTTFVALSALFAFSANSLAAEPVEGKEYKVVSQAPSSQKEVVELFSFYCPHCYAFELQYKIPSQIKEKLPADVKFTQYHVDFLGRQSENLTRAWAFAMAKGVEDNVKTALFEGAQKDAFKSMNDIKAVFLANGVSEADFDSGINSFAVNGLVSKQTQYAERFKVRGVPAFFINDKYEINLEGVSDSTSTGAVILRYGDAVTFLTNK